MPTAAGPGRIEPGCRSRSACAPCGISHSRGAAAGAGRAAPAGYTARFFGGQTKEEPMPLPRRTLLGTAAAATLLQSPARAQNNVIRIGVLNDQSGPYR